MELTAQFGLDHAQTLAVLLPSLLLVCGESKRAKLLQYADRVWRITEGDEDQRIAQAIEKTRTFFENLGVKTHLSDYGISRDAIDTVVQQLQKHGMTELGEHKDVTPEVSRQVLEASF